MSLLELRIIRIIRINNWDEFQLSRIKSGKISGYKNQYAKLCFLHNNKYIENEKF